MDIDCFKRMYRMVDYQRRLCMCDVCSRSKWEELTGKISVKQLDYLMLIRLAMPCNLQTVMTLTGLSSSAASLFVDKMTKQGVILREQDPKDRRNIMIRPGEKLMELLNEIDQELHRIISNELRDCSPEQISELDRSCALVCQKLEKINAASVLP